MCTAAEAKTLQRVYGRYNSFFRKVIPAKRVQKPVLWYTRLTVYGNPGRVVNGCAPGFARLFCRQNGPSSRDGVRPRSYRGTRPRFASGTLMSLRTIPPLLTLAPSRSAGVAIPSGSDIRVPSRVLSAAKQGESGAPERVGSPAGAEEGYSAPTRPVGTRTITAFPSGTMRD